MMGHARAIFRTISMFLLLSGFVIYNMLRALFFGHDYTWTLLTRRKFSKLLLWYLNVDYQQIGKAPEGTFIYIGNHRSYLDPVLAHTDMLALPVAKAEVGHWPIIGYGVKVSGVLLVQRENKNSRHQTRKNIVTTIQDGHSVLVYPEGTTHTKPTTIDFKPGTFKIAASNKIPIVPVAVEFEDLNDAFVNDDTFVPHFYQSFKKRTMKAQVRFGEPILLEDDEALLEQTKAWIDAQMIEMRQAFNRV